MKQILLLCIISLGLFGVAEGKMVTEKATFAAGCFWGVEEAFRNVKGVISTTVGYTGGHLPKPTYKDVCSDKTGHAEAVLVEYNPAVVSYEQLLGIFWKIHDPTQVNKQGPDLGSQYRSVIYFHSPGQEKTALLSREKLQRSSGYKGKIATVIEPAAQFWPAEEYHQKYLQKKGRTICHF